MKIGVKAHIYNFEMRNRRKELGWSQRRLAEQINCNVAFIASVEGIKSVYASPLTFERLRLISFELDLPFDVIFPMDYLEAMMKGHLPKKWNHQMIIDSRINRINEINQSFMIQSGIEEIEEKIHKEYLMDGVGELLEELTPRESKVIELRYGLNGNKPHFFEEVARKLGVTSERIRQIEAGAKKKLRHKSYTKLREMRANL